MPPPWHVFTDSAERRESQLRSRLNHGGGRQGGTGCGNCQHVSRGAACGRQPGVCRQELCARGGAVHARAGAGSHTARAATALREAACRSLADATYGLCAQLAFGNRSAAYLHMNNAEVLRNAPAVAPCPLRSPSLPSWRCKTQTKPFGYVLRGSRCCFSCTSVLPGCTTCSRRCRATSDEQRHARRWAGYAMRVTRCGRCVSEGGSSNRRSRNGRTDLLAPQGLRHEPQNSVMQSQHDRVCRAVTEADKQVRRLAARCTRARCAPPLTHVFVLRSVPLWTTTIGWRCSAAFQVSSRQQGACTRMCSH